MSTSCLLCERCIDACPLSHMDLKSFLLASKREDYPTRLWNCTNCWKCQEVCPQGIDLWDIKMKDRLRYDPPQAMIQRASHLQTIGCALPISDETNQTREYYNLKPISLLNPELLSQLLE